MRRPLKSRQRLWKAGGERCTSNKPCSRPSFGRGIVAIFVDFEPLCGISAKRAAISVAVRHVGRDRSLMIWTDHQMDSQTASTTDLLATTQGEPHRMDDGSC